MGTKFSELPANGPITGAEIVCLSQDVATILTSVQATLDEIGDYFAEDPTFVTTVVNNATFTTELSSNTTFINALTSNSTYITNQAAILRTEVEEETAAYTLLLVDGDHKWKTITSATPVNLTVPPQSSVGWAANTYIELHQGGAGAVTIVPGAGVTILVNENLTLVMNGLDAVTAIKRLEEDVWIAFGNLVQL